ncbi:MAG: PQQ-binding-like beta-propeller repeat protein [Thermoguttaceae bacterium]
MTRSVLSLIVLVAVTSLPSNTYSASGDWPQWRGPNGDGHSADTGLLKQWPKDGPRLVWKATGLGLGYATVSVVGDRVFTMGDQGENNYLIALGRSDGQTLWTTKVGKAGAPGWGGFAGPRCSPTVDGDLVFAVGQYGEVCCANSATGKEIWRKDYAKDFGGQLPEWGYSGMPLVDGDRVILAPGGKRGDLVALKKDTGELIWQSKDFKDSIHYASPIVAEIDGVRQYIQLTDASVAGVAAADGRLLWRAPRKGQTAVVPTPIYHDGCVYVTSGYGAGCNLFKISSDAGKFSAEQVYANKLMTNHHGGAVLVGEYVYGYSDNKGWTCQDFKTGKAVWQSKHLGKGSLVYADGMLYLRAEAGTGAVALIEATPKAYREKSRFDQPDRSDKNSWPHPVVTGGRLYLRDQDVLLCYDVKGK